MPKGTASVPLLNKESKRALQSSEAAALWICRRDGGGRVTVLRS